MKFSANLGFLWADIGLPEAIHAAANAGFDAVECHWPYDQDADAIRDALQATGLPMLGLNTRRGDVEAGENGLMALPGREEDARAAVDEAFAYATRIGAEAVHLMAGRADGALAQEAFRRNLDYALNSAPDGLGLLIEPLNPFDAPGYFLRDTDHAAAVIADLASPRLRLMFDCYHVARTEGDVLAKLHQHRDIIGHIQFAGVPDRGRPDLGTLNYARVFDAIAKLGYERPLGAEYKPGGPTEHTLGWMRTYAE